MTYTGPVYDAGSGLLTQLLSPGCNWPDSESFSQHVRSLLLEFSFMATLYFHSVLIPGSKAWPSIYPRLANAPKGELAVLDMIKSRVDCTKSFLSKYQINPYDAKILEERLILISLTLKLKIWAVPLDLVFNLLVISSSCSSYPSFSRHGLLLLWAVSRAHHLVPHEFKDWIFRLIQFLPRFEKLVLLTYTSILWKIQIVEKKT